MTYDTRFPKPVDTHVGAQLKLRRVTMGITQQGLADEVGVTFQQIQKYETGANRISMSRLFDICRSLGVPVGYFFEGLDGELPAVKQDTIISMPGAVALMRHYQRLDSHARETLTGIARVMADNSEVRAAE